MPDDRSNLDRYNRGGSKYDPRGGSGQNNTGGDDPKNKYGDRKPYGGGKP